MKSTLHLSALLGSLLASPLMAQAGTIVAPASVSASIPDRANYPIGNLINKSGISAGYISGVTDFDAFVATTKLSVPPSFGGGWISTGGNSFPASIDFVFATSLNLTRLVIWNDTSFNGIGNFQVFSSSDALFTSLTSLGNFTATAQFVGTLGQVFDFSDADTRFIRISGSPIFSTSGVLSIGEFAFESSPAAPAPVPLPATALLLVAALGGLGLASRRRHTAA